MKTNPNLGPVQPLLPEENHSPHVLAGWGWRGAEGRLGDTLETWHPNLHWDPVHSHACSGLVRTGIGGPLEQPAQGSPVAGVCRTAARCLTTRLRTLLAPPSRCVSHVTPRAGASSGLCHLMPCARWCRHSRTLNGTARGEHGPRGGLLESPTRPGSPATTTPAPLLQFYFNPAERRLLRSCPGG